jgi:hypothetical protein
MRFEFILLFISLKVFSMSSPGDIALFQIASNTLSSMRDLNELITEQREFGENFERVYSKVDQAVWKADRTAIWLQDMRDLKDVEIQNLDDFNSVLAQLKNETSYLRKKMIESYRKNKETKKKINQSRQEEKSSKRKYQRYSRDIKSSMSPQMAEIETAKNTKDLVMENALLNKKIASLSVEVGKLTSIMQKRELQSINHSILEKKKLGQFDKGVIRQKEVRSK